MFANPRSPFADTGVYACCGASATARSTNRIASVVAPAVSTLTKSRSAVPGLRESSSG